MEKLALPQCWMTLIIVGVLLVKSKRNKWETTLLIDDFVELVAYFAGLYATKSLVFEAVKDTQHVDLALPQMAAAILIAYVSCRGIVRTFRRKDIVRPEKVIAEGDASGGPGSPMISQPPVAAPKDTRSGD